VLLVLVLAASGAAAEELYAVDDGHGHGGRRDGGHRW
jgi:hypothetical protein